MRLDARAGMAVYRFGSLPQERCDALVSTRRGGASGPPYASLNLGLRVGDECQTVVANRRRLFAAYGLALERTVWCRQVHGDRVVAAGAGDAGSGSESEAGAIADGDALVTDVPGLSLCMTVADCAPVLLYDPDRHVAGLAHAGWAGTVRRIASKAVAVMGERFGSDPGRLLAAIGPSIGPRDYEVGAEVVEALRAAYGEGAGALLCASRDDRALLDLWRANACDLESAGVSPARIEVAGVSTAAAPDVFYSHRAESRTGRFAAAVTLA